MNLLFFLFTSDADEDEEDGAGGRKVGSFTRVADWMMSGCDALVIDIRRSN